MDQTGQFATLGLSIEISSILGAGTCAGPLRQLKLRLSLLRFLYQHVTSSLIHLDKQRYGAIYKARQNWLKRCGFYAPQKVRVLRQKSAGFQDMRNNFCISYFGQLENLCLSKSDRIINLKTNHIFISRRSRPSWATRRELGSRKRAEGV